jgi:cyclopropane fatty-acyl-phospholipid synthase-like methyltransferase
MKGNSGINRIARAAVTLTAVSTLFIQSSSADPTAVDSQTPPHGKHGFHKSFANADEWVKIFDDPARDKWQKPDEVIKALDIGENDKIADIGAGTGYFSLRIAKQYPKVTVYAADVEPDMIEYLKKQTQTRSLPNHVPVAIPTNKAEFPAAVNLAIVVDTYHHIDDRAAYFGALKKQLVPNGRVAIIDFTAESPEGPPAKHRITAAEVQAEMRDAGYTFVENKQLLPYQYFLIFRADAPTPQS